MLVSPIAKPFPQFLIATGLPKTIQPNHAKNKKVLRPPIQLLADLKHYQQSGSNSTKVTKKCITVQKHIKR